MDLSDNQLVKLIRAGDSEAFAELVDRYQVQIFNMMYRFSGSADDAADLTQDVFCRAYERLGQYRQHHRFFSWLYTMALNHARDWSRKRRAHRQADHGYRPDDAAPETLPERVLETKQQIDGLAAALQVLPADRRELLILRYRHDCSIRDLAEIFDLSESAVKMRVQRSLTELGKLMEQHNREYRQNTG